MIILILLFKIIEFIISYQVMHVIMDRVSYKKISIIKLLEYQVMFYSLNFLFTMIINCKCTTYYTVQLVRTASFCLCVLPLPTFPPDPTTGYLFTLWIFFHRCLSFLPNPSSFRVGNIFSTI